MSAATTGVEAAKTNPGMETALAAHNVVWDTPSKDAHGSMPLGNGDVGINAWVEDNGDLVFYISKTDAWDENARLCKIGRVRVKFDPPLTPKDSFRQELKLRDAFSVDAGLCVTAFHECRLRPRRFANQIQWLNLLCGEIPGGLTHHCRRRSRLAQLGRQLLVPEYPPVLLANAR